MAASTAQVCQCITVMRYCLRFALGVSPPPAQFTHFANEGANLFRIRE